MYETTGKNNVSFRRNIDKMTLIKKVEKLISQPINQSFQLSSWVKGKSSYDRYFCGEI